MLDRLLMRGSRIIACATVYPAAAKLIHPLILPSPTLEYLRDRFLSLTIIITMI